MTCTRREWLRAAALGTAGVLVAGPSIAAAMGLAAPVPITVYKTPTCGCCKEWVKHVEANGFKAKTHDLQSLDETKRSLGVPERLQTCHTAVVGKYVIEGHVPADLVSRLVKEKPANIIGLAVPGMPVGSPGMEVGKQKQPYDVIAFTKDGKQSVYAKR